MNSLRLGSEGPRILALKKRLQNRGFNPGDVGTQFTIGTETAVRLFQQSVGLSPDGVVGSNTVAALGMPSIVSNVTLDMVAQMFPGTPRQNIRFHLPHVLMGLLDGQLADRAMMMMALGTIRAETASFQPVDEMISIFNTPIGGGPFSNYDSRADLGNQGPPDGSRFKGRGFVQLTGRANYLQIGNRIGLGTGLIDDPDLANDPEVAARILTSFLQTKENQIRHALSAKDLAAARKLVNGGSHGLADFQDAFRVGEGLIPALVEIRLAQAQGVGAGAGS